MLTFFTDPYPDELLYSTFARYHYYTGNIDLLDTIEDLFGKRSIIPSLYLGSNLKYLCKELEGRYSEEDLINKHTIFPFYKPFLPSDRQIQLVNEIKFGNCEGIYLSLGLTTGGICRKDGIQFCSECVKYDIDKFGEPYIHREHQLQGVLVCPHHKTILSNYKYNSKNISRIQYIRLEEKELNIDENEQKIDSAVIKHNETLVKLSQMSYKLLSYDFHNINREDILNCYKNLLYEKGFMSTGEKIHQKDLFYEFTRFYGNDLLHFLECNIDIDNNYNWLKVITRKTKRTSHPLRHLLLINFLIGDIDMFFNQLHKKYNPFGQGPWPCLNKAADHYMQDVINDVIITADYKTSMPVGTFKCTCGYVYARKGPDKSIEDRYKIGKTKEFGHVWDSKLFELLKEDTYSSRQLAKIMNCDSNTIRKKATDFNMNYFNKIKSCSVEDIKVKQDHKNGLKIEEYKNKVLITIKSNKSLGKLKIKALIPNEYRYICNKDKKWMDSVLPIYDSDCLIKKDSKINWNEKDDICLKLVDEKYKEIYDRIPYQRVTKSIIGTELGIRNLLYKYADKIPKTNMFIENNKESVEQFNIRKCKNIIESFINDDLPIQLWKVQRLAGIDTSDFYEIKDKLDLSL